MKQPFDLRVFQIYFKEEHLTRLEPQFKPFHNKLEDTTVFLESEVIRTLIESNAHIGATYFGVVAYKLREKLGFTKENWKNNKNIANISTQEFTVEEFTNQVYEMQPDVMSFQRHKAHDTVSVANGFHPGFKDFWTIIMSRIGIDWKPMVYQNVFYCNYFVARSEIYERFVKEFLAPAMNVMKTMPELYRYCNYPEPFPDHLKKQLAVDHWTFHPFLCERMFTHFAHMHKLNCLHY